MSEATPTRINGICAAIRSLVRRLINNAPLILACLGFLIHLGCAGLVTPTPIPDYTEITSLGAASDNSRLSLPHNAPRTIRKEVLDTNTVNKLARFGGVTDQELATVQVFKSTNNEDIMLGQLGSNEAGFKKLDELLRGYIQARQEGHTKAFLMAGLTNDLSVIKDRDLRVIATNRESYWSPIPVSWLKKMDADTQDYAADGTPIFEIPDNKEKSGLKTNAVGQKLPVAEVRRWAQYSLVDGGLGWEYYVSFRADGSLESILGTRCDAKEFDAKYAKVIKQVEAEADAEMKRDGIVGLGSVHTFWSLKREKLKAKGIEWKSPSELNPGTMFD